MRAAQLALVACCLLNLAGCPHAGGTPKAGEPAKPASRAEGRRQALPIGWLPLEGALSALHAGDEVSFLIRSPAPESLLKYLAGANSDARLRRGGVVIGRGTLDAAVLPRHRQASFVVDYDDPSIAELAARLGSEPTLVQIRALVASQFEQISYGEFWSASHAARKRRGDCSEHAVLVAAVARRLGLPARVLLGYAAITDGKLGFAVGHAWAQVHRGSRWVDVDATPLGDAPRSYLLGAELTDEGPGFALPILSALAGFRASSIEVLSEPTD